MTSNLCHLHKIGDLLEFNRTVHLHIVALVKVSKLLSRETPDFILLGFWILNSEEPCQLSWPNWLSDGDNHAGMCLSDRHPQQWWIERAADSDLVQSWLGYYRHRWCERLRACVCANGSYFKHAMWTRTIWKLTYIRCDWLALILYSSLYCFCQIVWQHRLREVMNYIPDMYTCHFWL